MSNSILTTSTFRAWGSADFLNHLRTDLMAQDALFTPLQSALEHGSYALLDQVVLIMLNHHEDAHSLFMDMGVSYTSSIPGCACEGDPTPESALSEYAVLRIIIDRKTASFTLQVLPQ